MVIKLIKYSAEWCGPCQTQEQILEDFDACEVEHVDVDEQSERSAKNGVMSVPTLVIESGGAEVERFVGLTQLEELEKAVSGLQ